MSTTLERGHSGTAGSGLHATPDKPRSDRALAHPVAPVVAPVTHADMMAPARRAPRRPTKRAPGGWGLLLFGVVVPALSILVELASGMCAEFLFDPIPTAWHVLLALSVPAANLLAWVALDMAWPLTARRGLIALGLLNGVAIAAGGYFALLFLPLVPFAVIALVYLGFGLLPLGPLLGLLAAIRARQRLQALAEWAGTGVPGVWAGMAAGVIAVGWLVGPGVVTNYGLGMAASENAGVRETGVRMLRRFGSERRLLARCYDGDRRGGSPWQVLSGTRRLPEETVQQVFYRVTGRPFDSFPNPTAERRSLLATSTRAEDDDAALRGLEAVGTLLPGLSAASSSIDGWVNGDAATAYFEWTIEFRNAESFPQEARTRVALPRGGCVSRLTLWINGEEREAAWGGRAQVRQAYEQVVRVQRRDPVLVTSSGVDRVMMQCFPVPAGGTMKVRVGITAPLELSAADRGEVVLPRLLDRNFRIDGAAPHAVRLRSRTPLASGGRGLAAASGDVALAGRVSEGDLAARVKIAARRDPAVNTVWFDDSFDTPGMTVVQRIEAAATRPPGRVVLALDGSTPMKPALDAVADALAALPAGVKVTALLASEGGATEVAGDATADVAAALRKVHCVGGQDGVPLLARAVEVAARERGAVVLWVHGPQPVVLDDPALLGEAVGRVGAGNVPKVMDLAVGVGRNVAAEALAEVARAEPVEAAGDMGAALRGLFCEWGRGGGKWVAVRERVNRRPGERGLDGARRGDVQVVRLWAKEEVERLCAAGPVPSRASAVELAVSHRLVTPVSGAVVLETQDQYDAAGLTPVAAVPLPAGVWAALVALPLLWLARKWMARAAAA